jgi:secreted trypsin-like serine protease
MLHRFARYPILALVALLLLIPTAMAASGDSDEVAGAVVTGAAAPAASAPAAAASMAQAQQFCGPSPECPVVTRTSAGWEIDRGGAGIYLDRSTGSDDD